MDNQEPSSDVVPTILITPPPSTMSDHEVRDIVQNVLIKVVGKPGMTYRRALSNFLNGTPRVVAATRSFIQQYSETAAKELKEATKKPLQHCDQCVRWRQEHGKPLCSMLVQDGCTRNDPEIIHWEMVCERLQEAKMMIGEQTRAEAAMLAEE